LSPLSLSGRTRLFKNFDISYRSEFDPYILDSTGTRNLNQTEWSVNRRLMRLKQTNWAASLNWRVNSKDLEKKGDKKIETADATIQAELDGTSILQEILKLTMRRFATRNLSGIQKNIKMLLSFAF
jgi:hypothetical protein